MMSICLGMQASDFCNAQTHPLIDLRGFWVIDQAQSDSFEDKFKDTGKHRETKFQFGLSGRTGGGHRRSPSGPTMGPRSGKGGGHDDMLQKILGAKALHIDGYGDVALTYDGNITRYLVPNPQGRVFSASGKELVGDEFGRTLSYWDNAVLVVETTTAWGVTLVERFRQTNESSSLVVSTSIEPPGRDAVKWTRVYDRARD